MLHYFCTSTAKLNLKSSLMVIVVLMLKIAGSVQPSIMASTFFGPSSGGYVEMRLLNSSHPACGVTVNALQALRAVSELEIISALDKVNTLPLIPSLLTKQ